MPPRCLVLLLAPELQPVASRQPLLLRKDPGTFLGKVAIDRLVNEALCDNLRSRHTAQHLLAKPRDSKKTCEARSPTSEHSSQSNEPQVGEIPTGTSALVQPSKGTSHGESLLSYASMSMDQLSNDENPESSTSVQSDHSHYFGPECYLENQTPPTSPTERAHFFAFCIENKPTLLNSRSFLKRLRDAL